MNTNAGGMASRGGGRTYSITLLVGKSSPAGEVQKKMPTSLSSVSPGCFAMLAAPRTGRTGRGAEAKPLAKRRPAPAVFLFCRRTRAAALHRARGLAPQGRPPPHGRHRGSGRSDRGLSPPVVAATRRQTQAAAKAAAADTRQRRTGEVRLGNLGVVLRKVVAGEAQRARPDLRGELGARRGASASRVCGCGGWWFCLRLR